MSGSLASSASIGRRARRCVVGHVVALNSTAVGLDRDRLGHAVDEQHRAEREADDDAFGQVAEDDQREGDEQHQRVAARGADERAEGVLLDHVPGDDRQHAGKRGKRDVARQRCGERA